jgi:hypothetical protein
MQMGTVRFDGGHVLGGPGYKLHVTTHNQEEILYPGRLWKRIRVADHAFRSAAKRRNARSFWSVPRLHFHVVVT